MWATGQSGAAGPLLTLGEMLEDLAEEETAKPTKSGPRGVSGPSPDSLRAQFEALYGELNSAMTRADHSWPPLTQQLCQALGAANELVSVSQGSLQSLAGDVAALQQLVARGRECAEKLQSAGLQAGAARDSVV